MNKIKLLLIALVATFSFSTCTEDVPAKMLWEVSGNPNGNVDVSVHYDYYSPIWIFVGGYAGEATLKCTNYSDVSIYGPKNEEGEYIDNDCKFSAKVIEPRTIKITFDNMEEDFKETSCFLQIDGRNGDETTSTMVTIVRKNMN